MYEKDLKNGVYLAVITPINEVLMFDVDEVLRNADVLASPCGKNQSSPAGQYNLKGLLSHEFSSPAASMWRKSFAESAITMKQLVRSRWLCIYDFQTAYNKNMNYVDSNPLFNPNIFEVASVALIDIPLKSFHNSPLPGSAVLPPPFVLISLNMSSLLFTVDGTLVSVFGTPLIHPLQGRLTYDISYCTSDRYRDSLFEILSKKSINKQEIRCLFVSYDILYREMRSLIPPQIMHVAEQETTTSSRRGMTSV
jgi:hypothetical protein